jgi:hypothetical protein
MPRCKCSHDRGDHDTGYGTEECRRDLHPACYCDEFRLDPRSLIAGEDAAMREAG